jgi:transcriptional regulator with GAF, ATPase, and Fis domain
MKVGTAYAEKRIEASDSKATDSGMRFGRMIGGSPEMRRLYPVVEQLAQSDVPLVIEGETGTGKEQLARSLHDRGPRASGPFVVFDCTVGSTLMESSLFGHERGAFTGAIAARRGAFEVADGGTLLIDEVGELDGILQAKLLRAIDSGEVQRVGSDRWTQANVRVIAATRRNLEGEIAAGRFRDDLFYRLAVARVELPPLRERTGDVSLLARHFWRTLGGPGALPDDFASHFHDYDWPGNVRELYNAMVHRVSLGQFPRPRQSGTHPASAMKGAPPADLIEEILSRNHPFPAARDAIVAEFERRYVERLIALHGGSVSRAAAASGVVPRYFQRIRARGRAP